ncbi:MAG: M48 family metalloprotease [Prevotellaceae bacterium]|jgi:heat shock protein HtpX|nr:M48 family metalloprotease [Prevotellaceae bacterium]
MQKKIVKSIWLALFVSLLMPNTLFAEEKRLVFDNTGSITDSELEALNDYARNISQKRRFNVAFLLTDSSYAPQKELFYFALEHYSKNIGYKVPGFMLVYDKESNLWDMCTSGDGSKVLTSAVRKKFLDVFWANRKPYSDGIKAYLDAADVYLGKMPLWSYVVEDVFFSITVIMILFWVPLFILSFVMRFPTGKYKYVGIQTQKRRNYVRSTILLLVFPLIFIFVTWFVAMGISTVVYSGESVVELQITATEMRVILWSFLICLGWFMVCYYSSAAMLKSISGANSLERSQNKRVYNLVENLCMATAMNMPKINIVEHTSLNAFASGMTNKSVTITLSRGLLDNLDDSELEAVIAHELMHIRNNDVKMMMIFTIFSGLFFLVYQLTLGNIFSIFRGRRSRKSGIKNLPAVIGIMLFIGIPMLLGILLTQALRVAVSRNREFMADAGCAEMTKNPLALASALRKIAADPYVDEMLDGAISQLCIADPKKKRDSSKQRESKTHPFIEKRINILEQF